MITGFFNPFLVPDTWNEAPLTQPQRAALRMAVYDLTLFLCLATTIDDEVADFTHKDGWRKVNKVLYLAYYISPKTPSWLSISWSIWIGWLRLFAENLTVSDLPFLCAGNQSHFVVCRSESLRLVRL